MLPDLACHNTRTGLLYSLIVKIVLHYKIYYVGDTYGNGIVWKQLQIHIRKIKFHANLPFLEDESKKTYLSNTNVK